MYIDFVSPEMLTCKLASMVINKICFYRDINTPYVVFIIHNRFVATLASKDLVNKDYTSVFKFDEYFHLSQTQV